MSAPGSAPVTGEEHPGRRVVFRGGLAFTGGQTRPERLDVSVVDGAVEAVGDPEEVAGLVSAQARVVELDGGLLLPGFQDAHAHPVTAGVELLRCELSTARDVAQACQLVEQYLRGNPREEWVLGGGWSMELFPGGTPTSELLDRVTGQRPTLLLNRDHHGAWFNSAARLAAGIGAHTPDPPDGRFERDADGTPNGTAHEGAVNLFDAVTPKPTPQLLSQGLQRAQQEMLSVGVTSWQDAMVGEGAGFVDVLDTYLQAHERGQLAVRVTLDLWWQRQRGMEQLPELLARRARVRELGRTDWIDAPIVKVMLDGVAENFTAHLRDCYLDGHGHPTSNHGLAFVDDETLTELTTTLDREGFGVHFHALGDGAVRRALDAVTAARAANGHSPWPHQLAHLQVVARDDIPRFAALGAIANLQALWACREVQFVELTEPFMSSEQLRQTYPFGQLARAGAPLAAGSDWPVSSPDPLQAAYVATHRLPPDGLADRVLTADSERLDLATFLTSYTAGSAAAAGRGTSTGRLCPGHRADLVVLDRDPFASSEELAKAAVVRTFVDGVQRWSAS